MTLPAPLVMRAADLRSEGRHADALRLLQQALAETEQEPAPGRSSIFMTMFQWEMLADEHAPALAALREVRDDQILRVLAGDLYVGRTAPDAPDAGIFHRITRFSLIVDMNGTLRQPQSTHDLFARLDVAQPKLARQYAWLALPDVVAAGNFALANRYRGEPLAQLGAVNDSGRLRPLFPAPGTAPRLASELTTLVRDVRIGVAVLRGLGDEAGAQALGAALLAGLACEEMRMLARRELIEPGAITREIVERQMAQEELAG